MLECLDHSCFSSFRSAPVALRALPALPLAMFRVEEIGLKCRVCRAAEVTEARETHLLSMSFTWIFNGFYWILMDFGAL